MQIRLHKKANFSGQKQWHISYSDRWVKYFFTGSAMTYRKDQLIGSYAKYLAQFSGMEKFSCGRKFIALVSTPTVKIILIFTLWPQNFQRSIWNLPIRARHVRCSMAKHRALWPSINPALIGPFTRFDGTIGPIRWGPLWHVKLSVWTKIFQKKMQNGYADISLQPVLGTDKLNFGSIKLNPKLLWLVSFALIR